MKSKRQDEELRFLTEFLETPAIHSKLALEVIDEKNRVVRRVSGVAHSPTRNMYNIWFGHLSNAEFDGTSGEGASHYNLRDKGGTYRNLVGNVPRFVWQGTAVGISQGLQLGTGSTSYSFNDYILASAVPHGTDTGQMFYHAHRSAYITGVWVTSSRIVRHATARTVTNNTSQAIIAAEMGFTGRLQYGAQQWTVLLFRDVLSAVVTVPTNNLVRVKYHIETPAWPS